MIGLGAFSMVCMMGDLYAVVGGLTLLLEFSNLFLSSRSLLSMHGYKKEFIYLLNGLVFTLTYTLLRFFYLLWIFFLVHYYYVYQWNLFDPLSFFHLWFLGAIWAGTALNLVWFRLIIKGLLKVIRGDKKEVK